MRKLGLVHWSIYLMHLQYFSRHCGTHRFPSSSSLRDNCRWKADNQKSRASTCRIIVEDHRRAWTLLIFSCSASSSILYSDDKEFETHSSHGDYHLDFGIGHLLSRLQQIDLLTQQKYSAADILYQPIHTLHQTLSRHGTTRLNRPVAIFILLIVQFQDF